MTIATSRHFSKIVQDYVGHFDSTAIKKFFPSSPFPDDLTVRGIIKTRLAEVALPARSGLRQQVIERITETHRNADGLSDAVKENLRRFSDTNCLAIVTGQQVGILAGPLYTLYKTLHTVIVARQYKMRFPEYSFVPIFWQETEDHDFPEVSSVGVVNANFQLTHVTYTPHEPPDRKQVGAMRFESEALATFFDELRSSLPTTEFSDEVVAFCEECYTSGVSFAEGQTRMLCRLFAEDGLLILNANSRSLKQYVAPIFAKEITSSPILSDTINAYSVPLRESYHAQIDANGLNTFFIEGGKRYKLHRLSDGYSYNDIPISETTLLGLLHSEPERFSMNVVLRPLVQDTILPTVAYVAGPGEIAYFAQLSSTYEWAQIQMPTIIPRISLTIVDDKFYKLAEKFGTTVESLLENGPELVKEILKSETESEISVAFERVGQELENSIEFLRSFVENADATLGASLTTLKGKSITQLRDFGSKVVSAERKKQSTSRAQFEKAFQLLLPENKLQERELNLVYFLNRYGLGFWDLFKEHVRQSDFSLLEHHLVAISSIFSLKEVDKK